MCPEGTGDHIDYMECVEPSAHGAEQLLFSQVWLIYTTAATCTFPPTSHIICYSLTQILPKLHPPPF